MRDTTAENFARTPMIMTMRCLIDVHGSNSRLDLGAGCSLVNNHSDFTNEVIDGNLVEDLYATAAFKQDDEAYVDCYNMNTKKRINIRMVDFNLYNLEYILKCML